MLKLKKTCQYTESGKRRDRKAESDMRMYEYQPTKYEYYQSFIP